MIGQRHGDSFPQDEAGYDILPLENDKNHREILRLQTELFENHFDPPPIFYETDEERDRYFEEMELLREKIDNETATRDEKRTYLTKKAKEVKTKMNTLNLFMSKVNLTSDAKRERYLSETPDLETDLENATDAFLAFRKEFLQYKSELRRLPLFESAQASIE